MQITKQRVAQTGGWIAMAGLAIFLGYAGYTLFMGNPWYLIGFFVAYIGLVIRVAAAMGGAVTPPPPEEPTQQSYPGNRTQDALVFVILLSALFVVLTLALLDNYSSISQAMSRSMRQALITLAAGGIGSSIRTVMGYLKHASTESDFDPRYLPWFILRPIVGSLLAVIFYFLLAGGLLAVMPAEEPIATDQLKLEALAAVGGLVGFLSKEATKKLSEVFEVLFWTERLVPEGVRERVIAEHEEQKAKGELEEFYKELHGEEGDQAKKAALEKAWTAAQRAGVQAIKDKDSLLAVLKTYMSEDERKQF